jgi:hypothetical protein
VYGDHQFTTFEVGENLTPVTVETFNMPDHNIVDFVLFGKYIIAAVESKAVSTDLEMNKVDLIKMTFGGKISQTLPVNYSTDEKQKAN